MIDLKDIISISGKPGLYRVLKNSRKGVIVESLTDGKRMPVHAAHKISALEDISVYTTEEDLPLGDMMYKIYQQEDGGATIHHKSNQEELMEHARKILPEMDEDRVYPSDVKKMFQWYNILHEAEALKVKEKDDEEEAGAEKQGTEEGDTEEKATENENEKKPSQTAEKEGQEKKTPSGGSEKGGETEDDEN